MSDRPIDVNLTNTTAKNISAAVSEETRAQKKARLASVLERGMTGDRLHVDLPASLHGEWVPADDLEIARMEAMGFRKDTEYAKKKSLHSAGDGYSKVGDVIFMICDADDKKLIDEIRRDQFERVHGKPGQTKNLPEEQQFKAQNQLPSIDEGKTEQVQLTVTEKK